MTHNIGHELVELYWTSQTTPVKIDYAWSYLGLIYSTHNSWITLQIMSPIGSRRDTGIAVHFSENTWKDTVPKKKHLSPSSPLLTDGSRISKWGITPTSHFMGLFAKPFPHLCGSARTLFLKPAVSSAQEAVRQRYHPSLYIVGVNINLSIRRLIW